MPLLHLPVELVDAIIARVSGLDDLHALALTCHILHQRVLRMPSAELLAIFSISYHLPHLTLLASGKALQFADLFFDPMQYRIDKESFLKEGYDESLCNTILRLSSLSFQDIKSARKFVMEIPLVCMPGHLYPVSHFTSYREILTMETCCQLCLY